jgi:hypothetical protein
VGVVRNQRVFGDTRQGWQTHANMTSGQAFINTEPVPVVIYANALSQPTGGNLSISVQGWTVDKDVSTATATLAVNAIVPPGSTYALNYSGNQNLNIFKYAQT